MRLITLLAAGVMAAGVCSAQAPADSLSVAVATEIGQSLKGSLDHLASLGAAVDTDIFCATLAKVLKAEPTGLTPDQAREYIDAYMAATRPAEMPDVLPADSQAQFVADMAKMPGAKKYPSGLVVITEAEGSGPLVTANDRVVVKYTGRFYNGDIFDATGSPIELPVSGLAPGFTEGLLTMRPGGKARFIIPADLGYGPEGIAGVIPGNAALDFQVELLKIL